MENAFASVNFPMQSCCTALRYIDRNVNKIFSRCDIRCEDPNTGFQNGSPLSLDTYQTALHLPWPNLEMHCQALSCAQKWWFWNDHAWCSAWRRLKRWKTVYPGWSQEKELRTFRGMKNSPWSAFGPLLCSQPRTRFQHLNVAVLRLGDLMTGSILNAVCGRFCRRPCSEEMFSSLFLDTFSQPQTCKIPFENDHYPYFRDKTCTFPLLLYQCHCRAPLLFSKIWIQWIKNFEFSVKGIATYKKSNV